MTTGAPDSERATTSAPGGVGRARHRRRRRRREQHGVRPKTCDEIGRPRGMKCSCAAQQLGTLRKLWIDDRDDVSGVQRRSRTRACSPRASTRRHRRAHSVRRDSSRSLGDCAGAARVLHSTVVAEGESVVRATVSTSPERATTLVSPDSDTATRARRTPISRRHSREVRSSPAHRSESPTRRRALRAPGCRLNHVDRGRDGARRRARLDQRRRLRFARQALRFTPRGVDGSLAGWGRALHAGARVEHDRACQCPRRARACDSRCATAAARAPRPPRRECRARVSEKPEIVHARATRRQQPRRLEKAERRKALHARVSAPEQVNEDGQARSRRARPTPTDFCQIISAPRAALAGDEAAAATQQIVAQRDLRRRARSTSARSRRRRAARCSGSASRNS